MSLSSPLADARKVFGEYPRQFWFLILGVFIDRLGGAILFPFITLYITRRFNVGMTQVGLLFGLMSIANLFGAILGGALTDRLGRKRMLIYGLAISGLSSLVLGFVGVYELFFVAVLLVGLLASIGGPAGQAMVADLLPEEKRAQGFGILRVAVNLAVTFGPMIGGLLASQSYMFLFVGDAVTSLVTAGLAYVVLRETRPVPREGEPEQTMTQTMRGYGDVFRDVTFVLFTGACILMTLVYIQMNTTLAVYLRDVHGVPERGFGYILSLNAAMVVLFQFPITRRIAKYRPLNLMAVGTLLYALGFGMYGLVSSYVLFLLAMAIITIGEMIVAPTGQALVASFAPEDMRGRYMAFSGLSWIVPSSIGPLLAGAIMDNADPRWVWYAAGLVGLAGAAGFALLRRRVGRVADEPSLAAEAAPPADWSGVAAEELME